MKKIIALMLMSMVLLALTACSEETPVYTSEEVDQIVLELQAELDTLTEDLATAQSELNELRASQETIYDDLENLEWFAELLDGAVTEVDLATDYDLIITRDETYSETYVYRPTEDEETITIMIETSGEIDFAFYLGSLLTDYDYYTCSYSPCEYTFTITESFEFEFENWYTENRYISFMILKEE